MVKIFEFVKYFIFEIEVALQIIVEVALNFMNLFFTYSSFMAELQMTFRPFIMEDPSYSSLVWVVQTS